MSCQYHQYHNTVSKDLYKQKMKLVDLSLLLAVIPTILRTLEFITIIILWFSKWLGFSGHGRPEFVRFRVLPKINNNTHRGLLSYK